MVVELKNKEVLTDLEARKKYRDKYIGYITVEQNVFDPDNEKIIALYTADGYDESYKIPPETNKGQLIARMAGLGVGGTEIGGICFDE